MKSSPSNCGHGPQSWSFAGTPTKLVDDRTLGKRIAFIMSSLPLQCARVLDVGCGMGVYLEPLSRYSAQAVGIDIDYGYLCAASGTGLNRRTHVAQMDVGMLGFAESSFDAVTMIEVLEHITDHTMALREIGRVLKRGGCLMITAPSKLFLFETHPVRIRGAQMGSRWGTGIPFLPLMPRRLRRHFATVRLYYPWELRKMLEDNGFAVRTMDFLMPSLDALSRKVPDKAARIVALAARMCDLLERSPLRMLGPTIVVEAINIG